MSESNEFDLIVVGGGILGAFHAYHAVQRGLRVGLMERNARPLDATVRNFGQVVPSGMDLHWQNHGRESLQIYKSIQSQFDISVRQLGSIYLASDDEEQTLIEELHAINQSNDYPSELWTAEKCRQRYPQLKSDYVRGGLFFPEEISINPRRMIYQLHRYLDQHENYHAEFLTCIRDIRTSANGRVELETTCERKIRANQVIICSGSEFKILYPELFRSSDLTAVKLQMLRLKAQPQSTLPGNVLTGLSIRRYESFAECPSWSEIKAREPADCDWKKWSVHILFKQETDGSIILGDSHEYAPAGKIDELDFELDSNINDFMISEGKKIFDLPNWEVESSWYGIYCQTDHPSGIFTCCIDNDVHVVTGIGGKGMTSSAGFAKHHLGEIYGD